MAADQKEFSATVHEAAGVRVIKAQGRITLGQGATALRQLFDQAALDGAPQVVLNMAAVPYLDSAGLGSLVNGLKQMQERGGDLRLAAVQERVRELLEVTHLNRVLKLFGDEAEAAGSFGTAARPE